MKTEGYVLLDDSNGGGFYIRNKTVKIIDN